MPRKIHNISMLKILHPALTFSKLTIETLEQHVKYIQLK